MKPKNIFSPLNLTYMSMSIFFICLIYFLYINLKFFHLPIVEDHAFRQTQTALTAFYLLKNGFSLAYETPVIGQNWSIPLEFPIYQSIVAFLVHLGSSNLSITGRAVNLIFTMLTCIPYYYSLRLLKIQSSAIFFCMALFISTPVYLFWGGTFMIEGAALFFTLAFFYYSLVLINKSTANYQYLLFILFLTAGLLQKITTTLPVLAVMVIFYLVTFYKSNSKSYLAFIKAIFSVLIALSIAYGWILFSDSVKLNNPIGVGLTSSAMSGWNYGSLADRVSKKLWVTTIYLRSIAESSFYFFGLLSIFSSLIFLKDNSAKKAIVLFSFLFILPFLIFTNLHIRHNYYQFSNLIFLSAAVGISITYLVQQLKFQLRAFYKPTLFLIMCIFIFYNITFFKVGSLNSKIYAPNSDAKTTLILTDFIKKNTPVGSYVIWLTKMGWSSEFAFFSERKSLTGENQGSTPSDMIIHWDKYLQSKPKGIVFCPPEDKNNTDLFSSAIQRTFKGYQYSEIENCSIYIAP